MNGKRSLSIVGVLSTLLAGYFFMRMGPGSPVSLPPATYLPAVASSNGTAATSIPIELPVGFGPKLSIVYNSAGGNGTLGVGWSLTGLGAVLRDPVGLQYAANDRFLSPDGLLTAQGGGFRGRENPNHAFYQKVGSPANPTAITATAPNGTVRTYGQTADATIAAIGAPGAYAWALSKVADAHGNEYTISYLVDQGVYYPLTINYQSPGGTAQQVQFTYQTRSDAVQDLSWNYAIARGRRLTGITVNSGGGQYRRYSFAYDQSAHTSRSRLTAITARNANDQVLYDQQLTYDNTAAGMAGAQMVYNHSGTFPIGTTRYADFDGDGRTDMLHHNNLNKFMVALSNGTGFGGVNTWTQHSGNLVELAGTNTTSQARYPDLNGDGKADLAYQTTDNKFYMSLSTGAGFTTPTYWVGHGEPYVAGKAQYADVNGDGKTDLIYQNTNNEFYVSISTGTSFQTPVKWCDHGETFTAGRAHYPDLNGDGKADLVYINNANSFNVSLSNGSAFVHHGVWVTHGEAPVPGRAAFADMNGDGKMDLIYQNQVNQFYVSISTGAGFQTPSSWVDHGGTFIAGQAKYADVNGDGMADLVFHYSDNTIHFSISTGSSFSATHHWVTHGETFDARRGMLGDIDGDGRLELIWHGNNNITASFGNGPRADMLVSIDNGSSRVDLTYQDAVAQPGLMRPDLNQPGNFAMAVSQILTQVENAVGGSPTVRTMYAYTNARYYAPADPDDRQHLGFETTETRSFIWNGGWVEQPRYSRTEYDQHELGSSVVRMETRLTNGVILSETTNTYVTNPAPYPNTRQQRALNQATTAANTVAGVLQVATRKTLSNFDAFGYPRTIVDGGDLASTTDDVRTEITYNSCSPGLKGIVEVYNSVNAMISRTETAYDANCRPTSVTKGFGGVTTVTGFTYDGSGRTASITANGLTRTFAYSGETTTITFPNGRTTTTTADSAGGQVLTAKNAAGVTTVSEYDDSHRLTWKCVGLTDFCTGNPVKEQYDYTGLGNVGGDIVISDELGRSRTITLNDLGQTTRTVVADDRGTITTDNTHDIFGRLTQVSIDDGSGSYTARTRSFDSYGRITSVQIPGPNGTITSNPDLSPTVIAVAGQNGFEKAITDAAGRTIYEVRDLKGRLLQRDFQTEDNGTTQWGRERRHLNALGLPTKIERGYGTTRTGVSFDSKYEVTLTYDQLGRKKTQTESSKGTITYHYNAAGNISQKVLGDGTNIYYDYDALGRRSALRTDAKTIATYTYYGSGPNQGRPETIVDDTGTRTFSYDSYGRVSHIARNLGGGDLFDLQLTYDARGRLSSKKAVGTGMELQYEYFNTGALKKITLQDPNNHAIAAGSMVLVTYSNLNHHNKPENAAYGNGVDLAWTYQKETGLLTQMTAESGTLADLSYAYRDDAMLTGITDNNDANYSEIFAYDPANRLKTATGPYGTAASPSAIVNYSYAADGQLTSNGETGATQTFNTAVPHRLTSTSAGVAYTYNARGLVSRKVTGSSTLDFTYDHLNRPANITVDDGSKTSMTEFKYDDRGRRFLKDFTGDSQNIKTYYLDPDYRIRIQGTNELHTLIVRKPDGLLATFSFMHAQFTAQSGHDDIYWARAAAVAGLGTSAMFKRFKFLGEYLRHGGGTAFAMGGLALLAILLILFGVLRMDYSSLKRNARGARAGLEDFLGRPVRVTAWVTTQVLFAQFLIWPALNCVDNLDYSPVTQGDLVGNHFFISNHLRSAHIVTNESGTALAKYVYKPYGRLNTELTNADLDGDGKNFETTEKYTGQEYDFETGLYNYKARLYDTETGRFLQTDPKHKDMPGWTNYDRYSYVHGNPVNMTDPTGEISLSWSFVFNKGNPWHWAAAGVAANGGSVSAAVNSLKSNIDDARRRASSLLNDFKQRFVDQVNGWRNAAIQIIQVSYQSWLAVDPETGALVNEAAAQAALIWTNGIHKQLAEWVTGWREQVFHDIDHGFKAGMRNIDQGARRIGEEFEMERGNRHPNMRWDGVQNRALGFLDKAIGFSGYSVGKGLEWLGTKALAAAGIAVTGKFWLILGAVTVGYDLGYQLYLDANGLRPHPISPFGKLGYRVAATHFLSEGDQSIISQCALFMNSCAAGARDIGMTPRNVGRVDGLGASIRRDNAIRVGVAAGVLRPYLPF